jgi:hypothetical protein
MTYRQAAPLYVNTRHNRIVTYKNCISQVLINGDNLCYYQSITGEVLLYVCIF